MLDEAYGHDGLPVVTEAVDGPLIRWFTPSILERGNQRHHCIRLGDRLIARIVKRPCGHPKNGVPKRPIVRLRRFHREHRLPRKVAAMKTAFVLAAFVGTLSVATVSPVSACGMRFRPQPATELTLAQAAKHEAAEETHQALRLYERAMNDDRANLPLRIRAAVRAAHLQAKAGETAAANASYALVIELAAKVAIEALQAPRPEVALSP